MAKRPKLEWQIKARSKLDERGIGYKELADEICVPEGSIRQAMCKNIAPGVRKKICEYLNVEVKENAG